MDWRLLPRLRRRAAHALRSRGDRRRDQHDLEGALRRYRVAQHLAPPGDGTLRRVGRVAGLCGRPDLAERSWRRLAARQPDDPAPAARLARFAAEDGRLDEARRWAEVCLEHDDDLQSRFTQASVAQSLLAHLAQGPPSQPKHRHVALCGVSYCGSTLMSYFLGSLPGVANVGESHWLVHRANRAGGFAAARMDFDRDPLDLLPRCGHCRSPDCPVLSVALRRSLANDPVDWFERIAEAQGEPVLVSSDKNHRSLVALDPWLRFDAVVLFRNPLQAWASTRSKPDNRHTVNEYLAAWDREYRSFVHDLPNRGRKLYVDFEVVRRDLPRHLETLCGALDLPFDPRFVADVDRRQHAIGGNSRVHAGLRQEHSFEVAAADPVDLAAEEREAVMRYEARSPVLEALRSGHARVFGS